LCRRMCQVNQTCVNPYYSDYYYNRHCYYCRRSSWIFIDDRVVFHKHVHINSICYTSWVTTHPPPPPRRIIPRPMMTKPRLLITLLPRIPIPLLRRFDALIHCLIRRAAVRVIFLARNDFALVITLETGRVKMITELIPNQLRRRAIDALCPRLYQGDALLVIHDV
jgi:hypothetical protein